MNATPLLLAQLSDAHVGTAPSFLDGRIDTAQALQRAVQHLAQLDPAPELVLFTGDLTEHGRPSEYAEVARALAPLTMPVRVLPGNHDDPAAAREALAPYMPVAADAPAGSCCYRLRHGALHVVALDTVVPWRSHGELDAPRLAWLERTLAACRGEPVLLCMHHPPLATGMAAMDACSLLHGAEALAELVRGHGAVQGILCGHLHRPVQAMFAGAPLHVAPSVAHQMALDLRPEAPLRARLEPPKVSLHRWSPRHGLCTHLSYVEAFGEPLPL